MVHAISLQASQLTADRRGLQPTRSDLKQFPGRLQCERSETRLQKTTATGRPPARRRLDERQLSLSLSLSLSLCLAVRRAPLRATCFDKLSQLITQPARRRCWPPPRQCQSANGPMIAARLHGDDTWPPSANSRPSCYTGVLVDGLRAVC